MSSGLPNPNEPNPNEPNLEAIQAANPNLNLAEFISALQNGDKQVILNIQETGQTFEFKLIANETGSWIKAHPIQAGLISISAITCIAPVVATGPLFMALGLGAHGPLAGGATALFKSRFGPIAARRVLASLKSAAMKRYGAAAMKGVVSIFSATRGILAGLWGFKKKADEVVVKTGGAEDDSDETEETNIEEGNVDTYGKGKFEVGEDSTETAKL